MTGVFRTTFFGLVVLCCLYSTRGSQDDHMDKSLGSESFEMIRQGRFFVDKTMMIAETIKDPAHVTLITYPRRWGKTVNLKMIKEFFDITAPKSRMRMMFKETKIDINRNLPLCEKAWSMHGKRPVVYVDFKTVEGDTYLKILKSMKDALQDTFKSHRYLKESLQKKNRTADLERFQSYLQEDRPVNNIQLIGKLHDLEGCKIATWKFLINKQTEEEELCRQQHQLKTDLLRHEREMSAQNMTENEKHEHREKINSLSLEIKSGKSSLNQKRRDIKKINQQLKAISDEIANIMGDETEVYEKHIAKSLRFLTGLLREEHNTRVIVLVDEYDFAINNIFFETGEEKLLEDTTRVFRKLFTNTFKKDPEPDYGVQNKDTAVEFGVITGLLRIAKANMFSGLNNMVEYSMIRNTFYEYYGFLQEEVDDLLNRVFIVNNVTTHLTQADLKVAFDGYRVSNDLTIDIYNPWSIVHSVKENMVNYVLTTSGTINTYGEVLLADRFYPTVRTFIEGGSETIALGSLAFEVKDLTHLTKILHQEVEVTDEGKLLLLRLLFATGYLALEEDKTNMAAGPIGSQQLWKIRVANTEMRAHLSNVITRHYVIKYGIEKKLIDDATLALHNLLGHEDTSEFCKTLQKLFASFKRLTTKPDGNGIYFNERFVHSIIDVIIFDGLAKEKDSERYFEFGGSEIRYVKKKSASQKEVKLPDCILTRADVAGVIEVKINQGNADKALWQAKTNYSDYIEMYFNDLPVKHFIGINFDYKERRVQVKSEIVRKPTN